MGMIIVRITGDDRHDEELRGHADADIHRAPGDFLEVIQRQRQAHAEHDDSKQGDDIGRQLLERIGKDEAEHGEKNDPEGKGLSDKGGKRGDGFHGFTPRIVLPSALRLGDECFNPLNLPKITPSLLFPTDSSFPECLGEIIGERLYQIFQRRALGGLDEGFHRHARHDVLVAELRPSRRQSGLISAL
jgi:hypothetical protein